MDLLLVEDEPQLAGLLRGRLVRAGFTVDWKTSVPAAVGALTQRPYDVVLLDIVLKQADGHPTQDGLDVAREMRRLGVATPFVIMTSFPTFEHGLEIGELHAAASLEKGGKVQPIVEACLAAATAAHEATVDPLARAREEIAAVDRARTDAPDRYAAIVLRAIGHPALTLFQAAPLSRELVRLSTSAIVPDVSSLLQALQAPPAHGHADVDRLLGVLASGPVGTNASLSAAAGVSVKTAREVLKSRTGRSPNEWRCLARGRRLVGRLINTRDNIGQCADAAGYRYGRQCIPDCRRLFGRGPREIRRLLSQ